MARGQRPRPKSHTIKPKFDPSQYEIDASIYTDVPDYSKLRTTADLVSFMHAEKNVSIDARLLCYESKFARMSVRNFERSSFLETYRRAEQISKNKFKEAVDCFALDGGYSTSNAGLVGDDFVPMMGGPFFKQLYLHDYLKMNGLCFQAYNHDPIAHSIVQMYRDFTLGRGFRVDCDDAKALGMWRAFEEVNDLQSIMNHVAIELSIYGETMLWKLPNNETKIAQQILPGQAPPTGLIPRVRLIDPSVIWEIVTFPEDITRVLYYQWVSPTQYQIYTGTDANKPVPSLKFIYQQIPADQIIHVKINQVSNEKRGRSDLFPILGYLKRLRDSVNYKIIQEQKNSAWGIDTTIEGNDTDLDNYVADQQSLGTIPPAGSDFVHTSKVKREYLANQGGRGTSSGGAFDWCMSMIAAGSGIPISYFGTHLSGGQTRASALVATEPVAKRFEMRQTVYEGIIQKLIKSYFESMGMKNIPEFKVTFPEIITQDRSAKLKDISFAEEMQWITKEDAAVIAAKELQITDYDYSETQEQIKAEEPAPMMNPLSGPGLAKPAGDEEKPDKPSAVTSDERKSISDSSGY